MKQKYELMAPVGNFAMLHAALNAGADAVYFGIDSGFSMRAGSRNFKVPDLKKIKQICNSSPRKPKMYLTLNTIVYDEELKKAEKLIKKIKRSIDAVICWDLSIIELCKKHKIPFFISTQASVSNSKAANFYKNLGAKRIVLARELNLKQIKNISKIKGLEIEAFIHGAMCVAVSGRCFTSQFLFNRSANRGMCLHPCRRGYTVKDKQEGYELELNNNHIMSAKDLCTLSLIEDMKKSGITSFKIEGRNRDPRYVEAVVRIYRKALDKKLSKEEIKQGMQELQNIYNKGFSSGFYLGKPTPKDFSEVEHSASRKYKKYIGKISHYYDKINVITFIPIESLKIGDEISIIGKDTGIVNLKISEMEIKGKKVLLVKKGQEVGIRVPSKLKKNDEIYKIKNK